MKRRPVTIAVLLMLGLGVAGLVWHSAPNPVIRSTSLGEEAFGVAVDQATSRAFVITDLFFPASEPQGHVAVLDTRTGRLLRTLAVGMNPNGVAVAAREAHVYVSNQDDTLSVLDAATGTILHTVTLPSGLVLGYQDIAVNARTGRIYVATGYQLDHALHISGPGNLVVLDGATATIRRMVPFGYIPTGVAVDQQAGSVVVVDAGNQFRLRRLDAWGWVPSWLRPWLPFLPAPMPGTGAIPGTVTVLDTSRL